MRRLCCTLLLGALLLCGGCADEADVSGCWVSDDNPAYYFVLREDGSCFMFDDNDEWVSEGTYVADRAHIEFITDTGMFVWVREGETMVFDNGTTRTIYYRE